MESIETAKARALGKARLAAVVLGMLVLAGIAREYQAVSEPSDEAVAIYVSGGAAETVAEEVVLPQEKSAEETVLQAAANVMPEKIVAESVQEDGAVEFLNYMNELNGDLESVTKPESALEKIVLPEKAEVVENRNELFEEGKIEIYDTENGVVRVEEIVETQAVRADTNEAVVVEPAQVADEAASEAREDIPLQEATVAPEENVVVDNGNATPDTGNVVVETAEDDGAAIDLMKEIVERAAQEQENN